MIEKTKKLNVAAQKQIKQVKIALVGDCQTGKTAFSQQYLFGKFPINYEPTLGVETEKKQIQNKKNGMVLNLTLWDFSGRVDFLDIRNEFYKDMHAVLVFADLSNKSTVDGIDYWIKEAKDNGATNVLVVGNKADIKKIHDLQKMAKDKGCQYYEVSAKSGHNINQLLTRLISESK